MSSLKPREERRKTFLRARLRSDAGWSDVTIGNVSSRGMLLHCASGLRRNAFIELRHRGACIVGRIVCSHGMKCGVRTQDAIDVPALLAQAPAKAARRGLERRASPPRAAPRSPAEAAAASRRFARAFEWTIMVTAGVTGSGFVAQSAWAALHAPVAQVTMALAKADGGSGEPGG
jgi:hypothetical protein